MLTTAFLRAALERAVKTVAQAAVALLTGAGTGLLNTDWIGVLSVALMAGVMSMLTSIGTGALTDGAPAAGGTEMLPAHGKHADMKEASNPLPTVGGKLKD